MLFLILNSRTHQQSLLLRAGTCILYAHWEGFIKNAATNYLYFVDKQGLSFCDLSTSFVALGMRSKLRSSDGANRIMAYSKVTEFLLSDLRESATLPWEDAIDTKSNLKWEVLQDILYLFSLEDTNYAIKKAVIDEKLLFYRNQIAHGEQIDMDVNDYRLMQDTVLYLVDLFRNDIENAALIDLLHKDGGTPPLPCLARGIVGARSPRPMTYARGLMKKYQRA